MKPTTQQRLLQRFRKDFGISLAELAKEAKLSEAMLSRFEAGNRRLSPEAWTRVLAAIQKLLAEDDARHKQEQEKAVQTAAKLGAVTVMGVPLLPGIVAEALAFSPADLEKEGARLAKRGGLLSNLLAVEKSEVLRKLKNPKVAKQLLEHYFALIEWHQKILDLEAKGYVLTHKSVEEERDQLKARVAELEKELKDCQELLRVERNGREIAELEAQGCREELERERANRAGGGVTITPDVPERKASG